jgi:hypothetical protein
MKISAIVYGGASEVHFLKKSFLQKQEFSKTETGCRIKCGMTCQIKSKEALDTTLTIL